MAPQSRFLTTAKWALAVATFVLMASMGGGFLLLPLLIPAHVWAARRSGPAGRVGWSLLPAVSLAMVAWAAVYVVFGETKPVIWLIPVSVLFAALALVSRLAWRNVTSAVA